MSRRRAPRPAAEALRSALERAAPQTPLAVAQAAWAVAVGERVARVAAPVAERDGTLVIACEDPVWAAELELLQDDLLRRLREVLGENAPKSLRIRASSCKSF